MKRWQMEMVSQSRWNEYQQRVMIEEKTKVESQKELHTIFSLL